MEKKAIIKKMKVYATFKEKDIEERITDVKEMTFINLRDCLIGLGTILEEDFDLNVYIISVQAGVVNKNNAIVAVKLNNNKLYMFGYAREGLIKQHTAEKAMEKIEKKVLEHYK